VDGRRTGIHQQWRLHIGSLFKGLTALVVEV